MPENILKTKSFAFAIRIVNLHKYLKKEHKEFILAAQIMRSGTSVAASLRESEHAESLKDFIHKLNISLKEANETEYWLDLLFATDFLNTEIYNSLRKDCKELLRLLTASIKTSKLRISKMK